MRFGVQTPARVEIWLEISVTPAPLANSAMMSTLTGHCQWEDKTMRERTGHPPSYAVAKKTKSLTLHTHVCLRPRLRDWSSSSISLQSYHLTGSSNPYSPHYGSGASSLRLPNAEKTETRVHTNVHAVVTDAVLSRQLCRMSPTVFSIKNAF